MRHKLALLAAAAAIITGCGGGGSDEVAVTTSNDTSTTTTTVAQQTTTTEPPTTTTAATPTLGETATADDGFTATPYTLEYPATRPLTDDVEPKLPDSTWAILDAEICTGSSGAYLTGYGFTLVDSENRQFNSYDSTRQPFEPAMGSGEFTANECVRGLVNFEVPAGSQVVAIRWQYPGVGEPLKWTVP